MVRTPSPSLPTPHWQSKTPSNAHEIEQQTTLINDKFVNQNSSPTSRFNAVRSLAKGYQRRVALALLLSNELTSLHEVVKSVQPRRTRQAKAQTVPTALITDEMGL